MRKEFFFNVSRYFVTRYCQWAAVIARVEGGFVAFESRDDYRVWKNQR